MSSNKYKLIAFVGAFIPTEKLVASSRFKFIIDFLANYHLKRAYRNTPMKLVSPDGSEQWLKPWGDKTLTEQKADLELVGDVEDRCDVLEVKEDVIRGSAVVEIHEVTEEQVLKEIESRVKVKKEENLDEATARLEKIRQDMEKKKKANQSKITLIKG